ncbi:hypothetical protein ACLOJK_013204 [Asimina triloba]
MLQRGQRGIVSLVLEMIYGVSCSCCLLLFDYSNACPLFRASQGDAQEKVLCWGISSLLLLS